MAGKQRRRTTELRTGHILDVVLEQSKQTQDGASKTILKKIHELDNAWEASGTTLTSRRSDYSTPSAATAGSCSQLQLPPKNRAPPNRITGWTLICYQSSILGAFIASWLAPS